MNEQVTYKVYSYRWVVLLNYMLAAIMIQMLWATYFSITTEAGLYYGFTDATEGVNAISLLSVIFMIGMIALSFPSFVSFEKFGFKKSVGFGVVLSGVAALARGLLGQSYAAVFVCTIMFAIAQPFILNAVGMVAGRWFPVSERATANGLSVLSNFVGMMVGLLITPLLLESGMDIKNILLAYGISSMIIAVLFVSFVREAPPQPPCAPEKSERSGFMEGFRSLFKKREFVKGMVMYLIMLGILNTFFTLIEPILKQISGNALDVTQTGIIGIVILAMAIVGSFLIPFISDKKSNTNKNLYLSICMVIGTAGLALFIFVSTFTGNAAAAAVYGIFGLGCAPLILTYCGEVAFPTSEGTSEGLLMFGGNVAGVIILGLAGMLGGNYVILMWGMAILLTVATAISFTLKEKIS
ncbi:MFS transporter [Bacillota bacterium]